MKETVFRGLIGVSLSAFRKMRDYLDEQQANSGHKFQGGKRGPKPKLSIEDELMMLLMYYGEYRSFLHIGTTYGVSESQAWRIITSVEKQLVASKLFSLPGKKKLLEGQNHFEIVVVDVSEHPIERPKKGLY